MKRQSAFVGPTPEFVRWSIRQECPIRTDVELGNPDATERLLRSIREADLAEAQGRVVENFAIRRFAACPEYRTAGFWQQLPGNAAGAMPEEEVWPNNMDDCFAFSVEEVFSSWGGCESVKQHCCNCPANLFGPTANLELTSHALGLAGCHGLFLKNELVSDPQWEKKIRETWTECELADSGLGALENWYQIWIPENWQKVSLEGWARYFSRLAKTMVGPGNGFLLFCRALERCRQFGLKLDVRLFPAGESDGEHWRLELHCANCGGSQSDTEAFCRHCGRQGRGGHGKKRKVIGLRPYVPLKSLLSSEKTFEIWSQIEQRRKRKP